VDFSYGEEREALAELAGRILSDGVDHARLRELEAGGEWFDLALWRKLAGSGITALTLPESIGGAGLGILEACLVLEQVGRHVAPVPLLPTLVLGGLPLARFASPAQQQRWLGPVVRDAGIVTAALHEAGATDPLAPRTRARRERDGYRLDGEKECVPAAQLAGCVLVPARGDDGVAVFLVDPSAEGVSLERQETTHREPQSRLLLSGARVPDDALLGAAGEGDGILRWLVERAQVAQGAVALGVAAEALRRTAAYASSRKQFGRPIATFQAVAQRAADAYVDLEAMRATQLQAAWRLSEELPAALEVGAARWWACRGCERVVHAAQHLHGGIGADVDYPIHRFFLWSKQLSLSLGGATRELANLGGLLAGGSGAEAPS
jgi:alkylation response protein AidB-like acyl-CoA dehydrogenase